MSNREKKTRKVTASKRRGANLSKKPTKLGKAFVRGSKEHGLALAKIAYAGLNFFRGL